MLYFQEVRSLVSDLSLLIVDDDCPFLETMMGAMRSLFKTVDVAEDVSTGLELFHRNRGYDIVMTDVVMPGKDGLTLIQELRKIDRSQQIIMITAQQDPVLLNDAMLLGVRHVILKPITYDTLLTTLFNIGSVFPKKIAD